MSLVKLIAFGDNDSTGDANNVLAAIMKENEVSQYLFLGDGPYAKSGVKWTQMMAKYFDDAKKKLLMITRGNHDEDESESKQTQKDIEAWYPELKALGISDTWLSAKQVGNVYIINMDTQDLRVEFEDEQFKFVTDELVKAKQLRAEGKIDWIIVLFHKPFFTLKSSHSPYTAVRFMYRTIFRDAQVDFCLSGHNHNTQLWFPMIPNDSKANGEGEQLFKYAADNKTFDFTQDHGQLFIVNGISGHEFNPISDSGSGVANVQFYRDDAFGYTSLEINGKKAKVLSKKTDGTVDFEYNVTREGGVIDPPVKCKDNECKDRTTGKCRAIGANEIVDSEGFCKTKDDPDPDPTTKKCPKGYEFDPSLGHCIPLIDPVDEPDCGEGWKWNKITKLCERDGTIPPVDCTNPNECKDPQTGKCRSIGANEQKNPNTGLCETKVVTGCKDNECKDPVTKQCRPIGANEEKDTNGFCKPKTPDPGGDIDANGMRLLQKITGNTVDMEKGTDHRNGQRYNCNHKFLNYMVQGYFKLGKGQAKIEHKTDGPNHGGCTKLPICMWYEMGYEIATGRSELQYEAPHPDNHDIPDSALDFQKEVKVQPESWIGYEIAIWDSTEGRRMEQSIDPDPFDSTTGKPKNGWVKVLGATEKGQLMPKEYYPRNLKELIPKFENGFESEIRMHQGINHDTEMKWVKVYEIIPPN